MTLTSSSTKDVYTGDAITSVFPYTFKIFADGDLKVTEVLISTGAETLLTITIDYTVSDAGEASGGNVTLVAGALPSTKKLVIQRNQTQEQDLDLEENDNQPSNNVEITFDKVVAMIQQMQEEMDRSVKQSITETGSDITFPEASAGKALKWNTAEDGFVNSDNDPDEQTAAAAASASASSGSASAASSSASASSASASAASASAAEAADSAATLDLTAPEPIGSATPNTGAFTTLTGTTIDGIIGSVTPAAGTFTTLIGTTIDGSIGSVTPAAGIFLALTGTGTATFNDASNATVAQIDNGGTNHGVEILQPGVLASGKNAVRVYSNANQQNSSLALIHQDNASSTQVTLELIGDNGAQVLKIDHNGSSGAMFSLDSTSSGVQINATGNENLSAAGVWTDRTSTYAEKTNVSELDIAGFANKLRDMKIFKYQKKCEVYGNRIKNDNNGKTIKNKKARKFSNIAIRENAPFHIGHILDDPSTPEELIYRDLETGEIAGLSSQHGVHFLLAVVKELIARVETLEAV